MALPDTYIPVLTGKTAERFVRMAEENLKNAGSMPLPKEARDAYESIMRQYRENQQKDKK
jgi:hypothetical protein